ncbi:MAG: sulfur carrier protein ThiS [Sulfurimonas sp.]|jgi:sulfur carrier protein ThiS
MMNISENKQLDIVLPNTNKALKEVLKSASPKQLKALTQNKDLKSVINSLLSESTKSSASDKVLLAMLKNNPTLKELGNASTTIKDLLNSLKTNQESLSIEKILSKFISDMKKLSDVMPKEKHTRISTTSPESKVHTTQHELKDALKPIPVVVEKNSVLTPKSLNEEHKIQTPKSELRDTLKSLLVIVEKSSSLPVKALSLEIKNIINNEVLKNQIATPTTSSTLSTRSLSQISKTIDFVLRTLKSNIENVDLSSLKETLTNTSTDKIRTPLAIEKVLKEFLTDIKQLGVDGALKSKITDSGVFLESKLKNVQNPQVELKETLKSLQVLVEKSSIYPVKLLSKHIDTMLSSETLKNASSASLTQAPLDDKKALTQLVKGIEKIVFTLNINLKVGDVTSTKDFNTIIEKLQHQIQPKLLTAENFKLPSIQETIQQLVPMLNKSALPEAKGLLDALVKILQITPTTSLQQFTDKKIPQELQSAMQPLKTAMSKADPLFSKDIGLLLNKLNSLNSIQNLSSTNNIKEILENDLKSLLLKTSSEVSKSSHPNQAEIIKHIDKLALQIDYYQLISHLSNSSSIFLPFSWEALEEGNIKLKKGQDDKFYCDIELKLKEYGELNLRLVLYEENQLNIQIHSDNEEFKKIIKENIPSLRSALIESHITPREIRLLDSSKKLPTSLYEAPSQMMKEGINMGFEVKG